MFKYGFPFLLLLVGITAFGQQKKKKTKVYVEHADVQSYDEKKLGKDIESLTGHVKMRHEN
ncbi:MAG: hypothetical protein DRJ09_11780, partial [Bacteroidetes bacterium]